MLNKINVQPTRLSGVVVKQMDQGLLKAKDDYFTSVKLAARGLEADHGPWVVAQGISPALFEMWSAQQESRWKLAYETDRGRVLLYGDPSRVHENTGAFISDLIVFAVEDSALEAGGIAARNAARRALVPAASPLCQLVSSSKEPDFSRTPRDCMQHNPTLVGEVAYMNESFLELKRELTRWTARHDLAQMCIGVHINTGPQGAALDPHLKIVWKYHQQQHQQLAFGRGSACVSAVLPQYQFRIPFDALFARSSLRSLFGQRQHVSIDLFEIRTLIRESLASS